MKRKKSGVDVSRAWKDSNYRKGLSAKQRASLPDHPAGPSPASDEHLKAAVGGRRLRTTRVSAGTSYPDCCDNSTIGPKGGTVYPDCCSNSTIGPLRMG